MTNQWMANPIVKAFITHEIVCSIKYHFGAWYTIAGYVLLYPLFMSIIRSRSINDFTEAVISYPCGIATFAINGGMFGFLVAANKYEKEVLPNIGSYLISVGDAIVQEVDHKLKDMFNIH